jgi:NTP pyrophosphatase (non-canonical NTP hydrolase)
MSLKNIQEDVENWVSQFNPKYFKPLEILTAITEEVGELARELNNRYGPRTKKSPEDTADVEGEIGDILFNLTCLANSHNINLEDVWKRKMDKQNNRDKNRFEKNNKT